MLIGNDSEWSVESELPGLGYNEKFFTYMYIKYVLVRRITYTKTRHYIYITIKANYCMLLSPVQMKVTANMKEKSFFSLSSDQNYQPSADLRKCYYQILRVRLWQKQGVQGQKTQDFSWGFDCLSITFSHGVAVWGFFQVWLVGCTNAHLL